MGKNRILAKAIVNAIVDDLEDRDGLHDAWEEINIDYQMEVIHAWEEIVMECLS